MKKTRQVVVRVAARRGVGTLGVTAIFSAGLVLNSVGAYADSGSQVQLYGLIGTYVGSIKRSDTPQSAVQMGSGGLTTSFWGIRGKEDLGGGVGAIFVLESFFQPANGALGRSAADPFWSRNAYVGFQGDFGQVTFGRQRNPAYTAESLVNPFGSSTVFSPLVLQTFVTNYGGTIIGDTVWNNTVKYTTPDFKGFAATVIYGLGGVAGSPGVGNLGVHVNYRGHGLTAVLSGQRVRYTAAGPVGAQYAYLAGAAYDFKLVTLYGAWAMTSDASTPTGSHTYEAGLSIPLSPADFLLAEWARTKRSGATRAASGLRNTVSVGYNHLLSKRTDIYAIYAYDKLSAHPIGNSFAVGIRHTF
ncbi:porin [Burkholderia cenocepacia]|uniref:porin n=1 Tax=Burkholderia cenocepacia TaxID=95486 RepID=UPI001B93A69E|nr:porin [Burkholderia cenocepacia]MBR8278550.1 porin [Burkholderia cenocepacia]